MIQNITKERVDFLIQKFEQQYPELLYSILSMVTYPQPKQLMDDVKDFYKIRQLTHKIYEKRYRHQPEEAKNWLYNDLMIFYNEDTPAMVGYVDGYLEKIMRSSIYNKKENQRYISIKYIDHIENTKNVDSIINIYLSKLTPEEREYFLVSFQNE